MNWLILTLISVVIVSFANIIQKILMREDDSDPITYAIAFHFLLGLMVLFVALPFGYQLPNFNQNFIFFLLSALSWGLGTVLFFKALQLLQSSELTIIISSRALITIAASLIFLNESFSFQKVVGTILILSSVFLTQNVKQNFIMNKGFLYALGTSFLYGIAIVFDVINLRTHDSVSYLATINLLIGAMLAMLFWRKLPGIQKFLKFKLGSKMILLGVFSTGQAVTYFLALESGPLSQIAAIGQAQVVMTVILAVFILGEKDKLFQKILASVMVMVGVILLR